MTKYRVIRKAFIGNTLIDPETMPAEKCIVEYDGKPGGALELIEAESKGKSAKKGDKPEADLV